MKKDEMLAAIAEKSGLSKKDSGKAVAALCDVIREAMEKGDEVTLAGVGTFRTDIRGERTARNPQTGESIVIPESRVVKFKASSVLKKAVKG